MTNLELMKKTLNFKLSAILLVAVLFFTPTLSKAQVTIGEDKEPASFSLLELISDNSGLRMPHLTTAQRNDIALEIPDSNPDPDPDILKKGLWIYNTDINCLEYWNGRKWISLCKSICPTVRAIATVVSESGGIIGGDQSFSLEATIVPGGSDIPASRQWEYSNDGGVVWIPAPGKTDLEFSGPAQTGLTKYRFVTASDCDESVVISNVIDIIGRGVAEPLNDFYLYVGAFWRWNQTSERLIRILRPSSGYEGTPGVDGDSKYDGPWIANVSVGKEWIRLDDSPPGNNGVNWTTAPALSGNDAAFESNSAYKVTNTGYVTGVMDGNKKEIYFRIGLASQLQSATSQPRYGLVVLYYNTGRSQRIFIRQGEEPDYLMRPWDPKEDGTGWGSSVGSGTYRPAADIFSPFNATYTFEQRIPNNNEGLFTDYPSKPGAMFHWANATGSLTRFAHAPIGSEKWNEGFPSAGTSYWTGADFLAYYHETCPPNFRRPDDGPRSGPGNGLVGPQGDAVNGSEIRQSLWLNPKDGLAPTVDNSDDNTLWGYYADGYFDRRPITGNGRSVGAPANTLSNAPNVAYIGRLFFNPYNNASLFFPAAGYYDAGPVLSQNGNAGYYWTSSAPSGSYAWGLSAGSTFSYMPNEFNRGRAFNVRCVAFYCTPVTTVSLSASYEVNPPTPGTSITLTASGINSTATAPYAYAWEWRRVTSPESPWLPLRPNPDPEAPDQNMMTTEPNYTFDLPSSSGGPEAYQYRVAARTKCNITPAYSNVITVNLN